MRHPVPNYYYSTDGVNSGGPIDVNGLAALLRARTITRKTPAILEGQQEWGIVGDYLPDTLRVGRQQIDDEGIDDEDDFVSTQTNSGRGANIIAAIASLVVPGLGQLTQGRVIAALLFFIFAVAL